MSKGTLAISWGPYGGFYWVRDTPFCTRLCLGFVAITHLKMELDDVIGEAAEKFRAETSK